MADIIELLERRDETGLALLKEKYADCPILKATVKKISEVSIRRSAGLRM